jgi:undecaprenyl-diphosphatase
MILMVVAGSVPTAAIGIIFKEPLEALFTSPWATVVGWTITGVLLVAAERLARGRRELPLTLPIALAVGAAQGVAIVPGISRSGATIAAALILGVAREEAFAFSFLLSLPAVLGAMVIEGELDALARGGLLTLAVGMTTAFALGLAALAWLSGFVRRGRLFPFALYCWVAAAVTGALLAGR